MRPRRAAVVAVLVVLLATSVGVGNAAVAAERTVLSGPFVKSTLSETDAYGTAVDLAVEGAVPGGDGEGGNETAGGPSGLFEGSAGAIVESAVTEPYVRGEVETNVDRLYGYLHGDRPEAVLAVDLAPVQDDVLAVLEARSRNASLGGLLESMGAANRSVPAAGTRLDLSVVARMDEGPAAYREAKAEFRADVRAGVVGRLAGDAYEAATDDERLETVVEGYDPDEYSAAEKRAMVAEREPEIRSAMRARVEAERADEVDAAVEERLARLAEVEGEDLAPRLNESSDGMPPPLVAPAAGVVAAGVRGLAPEATYGTFRADVDAAKARLAANVTALVEAQIRSEGSDRMVVADSRDPVEGEGLRVARTAVGAVDLLSVLLPLLAAGLVGGLWWRTRAPALTAGVSGAGLLLGGLPGFVLARLALSRLDGLVGEAGVPPAAGDLLLAIAGRVLGVAATQSLALVLLGGALFGLAAYLHVHGPPAWALRR